MQHTRQAQGCDPGNTAQAHTVRRTPASGLNPPNRRPQYFTNLLDFDWAKHKGPGDHFQWRPVHKPGRSNATHGELPDIMMLTTGAQTDWVWGGTQLCLCFRAARGCTGSGAVSSYCRHLSTTPALLHHCVRCAAEGAPSGPSSCLQPIPQPQ